MYYINFVLSCVRPIYTVPHTRRKVECNQSNAPHKWFAHKCIIKKVNKSAIAISLINSSVCKTLCMPYHGIRSDSSIKNRKLIMFHCTKDQYVFNWLIYSVNFIISSIFFHSFHFFLVNSFSSGLCQNQNSSHHIQFISQSQVNIFFSLLCAVNLKCCSALQC